MLTPQPGYAFVSILQPRPVWHSNVSPDQNQVLCLGPQLPAGIPLKEIILMTYGALTLQTTQLDRLDPAGVLNPAAAEWWQHNTQWIPLTREPFLRRGETWVRSPSPFPAGQRFSPRCATMASCRKVASIVARG